MQRRLVVASAIVLVMTAAFLPGSGFGSSARAARGMQAIPAGLAAAIHARLGAGRITPGFAARAELGPYFGFSVALSADGTTALVGAVGVGRLKGAAYIFHASDAGSWTSTDTPVAHLSSNAAGRVQKLFGWSVALSADGTTAFVGAPFAGSSQTTLGAVYVFHVASEDAWTSTSTATAALTASGDIFVGWALAASPDGTTLVVGAPFSEYDAGGAYVFHAASEDAWASTSTPTATLSNANQDPYDGGAGFGVAISGNGTTALVSDQGNPDGGGAYVFHASAEDAWTTDSSPTATLSDTSSGDNDGLGESLALSADGTVALLGAPGANADTGAVDVFHAASEAAWASTSTPTATLTSAGGMERDEFGLRLALSTDGTTALVSAPRVAGVRGAGYIFRVADEGSWVSSSSPAATLTSAGAHRRDSLGAAVALSADGASALLGAPEVHFETGAASVFHVTDASSWLTSSAPTAILTDSALNQCVVPRLKGKTVAAARTALKARSCNLGRVTRVVHARGKRGHVVAQSAPPGKRLALDAKVAIKVKRAPR